MKIDKTAAASSTEESTGAVSAHLPPVQLHVKLHSPSPNRFLLQKLGCFFQKLGVFLQKLGVFVSITREITLPSSACRSTGF